MRAVRKYAIEVTRAGQAVELRRITATAAINEVRNVMALLEVGDSVNVRIDRLEDDEVGRKPPESVR